MTGYDRRILIVEDDAFVGSLEDSSDWDDDRRDRRLHSFITRGHSEEWGASERGGLIGQYILSSR